MKSDLELGEEAERGGRDTSQGVKNMGKKYIYSHFALATTSEVLGAPNRPSQRPCAASRAVLGRCEASDGSNGEVQA